MKKLTLVVTGTALAVATGIWAFTALSQPKVYPKITYQQVLDSEDLASGECYVFGFEVKDKTKPVPYSACIEWAKFKADFSGKADPGTLHSMPLYVIARYTK